MSGIVLAGAAVVDITPPAGLAMSGFAARRQPAIGAHDPLTVRAVAVEDTAIVCADVIGLDADLSRRVRARAGLADDRIIVAALHTHGGPVSMRRRLGAAVDEALLARVEDACVAAIDSAVAARRPAQLLYGAGANPGVARNRRHAGGPVDPSLPVLRIRGVDGGWIAVVTAYACHPVTLGPDNLLWTADYPHVVRSGLEAAHPGAVALFLTGCAGDANMGHSAQASFSLAANSARTFAAAETIGARIAEAANAAPAQPLGATVAAADATVTLDFARRETEPPGRLAARWRREVAAADPGRAALLEAAAIWAETVAPLAPEPLAARISALSWGGVGIVALPGEIFAETALAIRARLGPAAGFVVAYADANPGYIPPASEFAHGGYEVDEAHRFYGMPATFAPGAAERLAAAAVAAARRLPLRA